MSKYRKKKKNPRTHHKPGLAPGSLVFVGEKRVEQIDGRLIRFDGEDFEENDYRNWKHIDKLKDDPQTCWVNIVGIHDESVIETLGQRLGVHPLVLEDIMNTTQRPKIEVFDDHLYIVLKMVRFDENGDNLDVEQVSFLLLDGLVVTFQERLGDTFEPVRDRLRAGKGRIRASGADYLLYTLVDAIVDHYFVILESFGDKMETLEDKMLQYSSSEQLAELQGMKREIINLRRAIWPIREVIASITRSEASLIRETTQFYFRDVYDHVIQVVDTLESFRDVLHGVQDLYLSVINNKMNEVMKMLALISTVFLPMTLVAGVYGMNFSNMPELDAAWGYPAALGLMFVIGSGMFLYFRWRKWI